MRAVRIMAAVLDIGNMMQDYWSLAVTPSEAFHAQRVFRPIEARHVARRATRCISAQFEPTRPDRSRRNAVRQNANLSKSFKLIWSVQMGRQKIPLP
jgi:hypothetical protein